MGVDGTAAAAAAAAVAPLSSGVMASAARRGDPPTPSSVGHSSRSRTPPNRDVREGYGVPQQA